MDRLIDSNTKARLKSVSRSLHINSPCFVVFYCGYFLHAAHHRVHVFVAEALYLCILWWEDEASQGLSLYSSCWMVPVRDDILKHLTHKNEFSARAQWQRWAIHSPKMWEDKKGGECNSAVKGGEQSQGVNLCLRMWRPYIKSVLQGNGFSLGDCLIWLTLWSRRSVAGQ